MNVYQNGECLLNEEKIVAEPWNGVAEPLNYRI